MDAEEFEPQEGTTSAYEAKRREQRLANRIELLLVLPRLMVWPVFFFILTSIAVGSLDLDTPVETGFFRLGWAELLAVLVILVGGGKAMGDALDERRGRRIFAARVDTVGSSIRHMSKDSTPAMVEELRRLTDRAVAAQDLVAVELLTTATLDLMRGDLDNAYQAVAELRSRDR